MPLERSSGILLHITSLGSRGEVGDLGPAALEFADFLAAAKQTIWQVLPSGPTGFGNSPYAGLSAFAGNPLLISLEKLAEAGWIGRGRLAELHDSDGRTHYDEAARLKLPLLFDAARNFLAHHDQEQWTRYETFCSESAFWLDDYAAFSVLRRRFSSVAWPSWPRELARRIEPAYDRFCEQEAEDIAAERVIQFAFEEQWRQLHNYCRERGIRLVGDIAIFVSYDSADVWTRPRLFEIDENLGLIRVAGVPPDYFSNTGQRWGNPLYRWDALEGQGFRWWVERVRRAQRLYDAVRLDHFRGFEAYWAIPAEERTAVHGEWVRGPGAKLFHKLQEELGELQFLAEDLGVITPEVEALRDEFGFPGMRVLQFGFGDKGAHVHLPHRYQRNSVVYTGTHDNDTTLGWWRHGVGERERAAVHAYLNPREDDVVWSMIRAAAASVSDLSIIPMQDVLELGSEARMNTPARSEDNWTWRMTPKALSAELASKLASLTEVTDRDRPQSG